jgi:hypothetical protein
MSLVFCIAPILEDEVEPRLGNNLATGLILINKCSFKREAVYIAIAVRDPRLRRSDASGDDVKEGCGDDNLYVIPDRVRPTGRESWIGCTVSDSVYCG